MQLGGCMWSSPCTAELRLPGRGRGRGWAGVGGGTFGESERVWWCWGALRTQVSQRLAQPVHPFPWWFGDSWGGRCGWPLGKAAQIPLATALPFSQLSQPPDFPCHHVTSLPCPPTGLSRCEHSIGQGGICRGLAGEVEPCLFFKGDSLFAPQASPPLAATDVSPTPRR